MTFLPDETWLSVVGVRGLEILIDSAVKATVLLGLAVGGSMLLRRASAAARHLVLLMGLAAAALLPAMSIALPQWHVLPSWFDWGGGTAQSDEAFEASAQAQPLPAPTTEVPTARTVPDAVRPAPEAPLAARDALAATEAAPPMARTTPQVIPTPSPGISDRGSMADVSILVLCIWALGALCLAVRALLGAMRVRHIGRTARKATDPSWLTLLRQTREELGTASHVDLLIHPTHRMPMVWGLRRPKILLPADALTWAHERRRAVLLHELAHIRRGDLVSLLLSQIACALHWFNPLVWIASRRMISESERACDDLALAADTRTDDYAQHILEVATGAVGETRPLIQSAVAIAMARPSHLEGRLLAVLDAARNRRPLSRAVTVTGIAATLSILVPLAMSQPAAHAVPKAGKNPDSFVRKLPGGVTVELLGLCEYPTPAERWWRPDGTVLEQAPFHKTGAKLTLADGLTAYEFAARVVGPKSPSIRWSVSPCQNATNTGHPKDATGKRLPDIWAYSATMRSELKECRVRVGIATGEWETIAEHPVVGTVESAVGTQKGGVTFHTPYFDEKTGHTIVNVGHTFLDLDTRLVAIDKQGKLHSPFSTTGTGVTGMVSRAYKFRLRLSNIEEFRFQTREYEYADFGRVSLKTEKGPNGSARGGNGDGASVTRPSLPKNLTEGQRLYAEWTWKTRQEVFVDPRLAGDPSPEKRAEVEQACLRDLRAPKTDAYYRAICTLGTLRSAKALKPLHKIAAERREKDNRDRWMAVRSLGLIGDKSVVPDLIHLLYHYNQNTRFWAQISLVRLTGKNFERDWRKWGQWWNEQNRQPEFDPKPITWTQRKDWADPKKQEELDRAAIVRLKQQKSTAKARRSHGSRRRSRRAGGSVPQIVSTSPPNGATDVDPSITEITVTFDRDMGTGFSWTGGGPEFPPSPEGAKAHWRDVRTCVLPVRLEAGKFYRVGINSTSYQNFRSADGVPARPTAIAFATKGADERTKRMVLKPKIVSMNPPNGAEDVDPKLDAIRVAFNVPMGKGFSWTGGGPTFPKVPAGKKPQWTEDGKTCVLPVELKPDSFYMLGLNSPSHKNFQSEGGVPLDPVLYTFRTAKE